jgi:hypothetical protein
VRTAASIVFTGTLQPRSFVEFAEHRAERLGLRLRVDEAGPEAVRVSLAGQPDLLDMFEMACSLGPVDCLVLDVQRIG